MVRRTKEEAEETRRLLLKTALKLFSEQGIHSVTLAQVAKAAGVTRGAIYWHFKDKADMLQAMWNSISEPLEAIYRPRFKASENDPLELLEDVARSVLLQIAGDEDMQQVIKISMQALGDPQLAQNAVTSCQKDRADLIGVMLRAKTFGSLRSDLTPEAAALAFHGFLDGVMSNWLLHGADSEWLINQADSLAGTITQGLRA